MNQPMNKRTDKQLKMELLQDTIDQINETAKVVFGNFDYPLAVLASEKLKTASTLLADYHKKLSLRTIKES